MARDSILKNSAVVGALTMASRLLGLVREMLQSRLIGAGMEQSAFTLAFAIPNMARKLFGEGALTAAFVPVFKGAVERGEREAARRLANAVMTTVFLILGAVTVIAVGALSAALGWQAPTAARSVLTLRLVRILLPYMLFICAAAFGMSVLNALGRFAPGAFMPAMLNLVWIAALALMCFFPSLSLAARVTVVAWAILLGGALQMTYLFVMMRRRGFGWRWRRPDFAEARFRLVWKNTLVAALGAGAVQVNYMLDQVLAQCAAPWAAGVIGYAERLMDLPVGVVGVAFGTVLLPTFAGHFARGDAAGARRALRRTLCQLLAVMVPASLVTFFAAPLIVQLVYEGHAFDAVATLRVSRALAVYALGLSFFAVQKCLVPFFQAQNDMRTPLKVTTLTVVLNAALNVTAIVTLSEEFRHVGLAASTSFCAFVGCVLLAVRLRRPTEVRA